ncbi:MAG: hybrid sensor histidine kinase/response regulator [Chthoniobacterales bacterium]|nr:MAG: hybrid sensor histidine kinase/response regulator [Chthoniobacterales bacterium]
MDAKVNEEEQLKSTALQTAKTILTARLRAEEQLIHAKEALEARTGELAHSLSMLSATLESTTDGILVTDENGRIITWNQKFIEMWRVPKEVIDSREHRKLQEITGKQFANPKSFSDAIAAIYAGSPPETFDVLEMTDGRVFERYSKIQSVASRNVGRVWSFRDITERRRAETERERLLVSEREARERAERETQMKDEFLATVSHELRTPLNAILGWANIVRAAQTPAEIAEGLEVIERNARSQAQIIEDLLDMSRIISGKVRLDVQRVELIPVINAALESVKPMAAGKEIRLTSVLDPLAGPISGDPARLQQILWNLLTNALKFTSKGGRVHVVLERVNSHLEISVSDTGRGIAPDFLPHVFDRFRQADASSTREQRGLGLGLSIVRNLAELHGGGVSAKSEGLQKGSTFTVAVPIATATTDADPDRRHPRAGTGEIAREKIDLQNVRVLAVDDEADARVLIKRILGACGAEVETADSGAAALKILRETRPDVLIMDIGMPTEDGYTVIRKMRELSSDEGGSVPAIALTAFARSEDRRRAVLSGFQMHMAKPVEAPELIAMVASLAGRTQEARTTDTKVTTAR